VAQTMEIVRGERVCLTHRQVLSSIGGLGPTGQSRLSHAHAIFVYLYIIQHILNFFPRFWQRRKLFSLCIVNIKFNIMQVTYLQRFWLRNTSNNCTHYFTRFLIIIFNSFAFGRYRYNLSLYILITKNAIIISDLKKLIKYF